jgi:hypothetical protein
MQSTSPASTETARISAPLWSSLQAPVRDQCGPSLRYLTPIQAMVIGRPNANTGNDHAPMRRPIAHQVGLQHTPITMQQTGVSGCV